MHLSGELSDWSIGDLLRIMQVTGKTASLVIEGERRGRVHFRDGLVTGAELEGVERVSRQEVSDVVYVLSRLDRGRFDVGAPLGPDAAGRHVEEVLDDLARLRGLEDEVAKAGLVEAEAVRIVDAVEEAVTIQPDEWSTISSLLAPFSFAELEERLGRGAAVRVFHTLHKLGVAEPTEAIETPPEEASWLDRLAGNVAYRPLPVPDPEPSPETVVPEPEDDEDEVAVALAELVEDQADEEISVEVEKREHRIPGVAAPASTTLTTGVYDEIRRLRSRGNR